MAGLVGAGRTDVARAIFGIAPATSGIIRIDGQTANITHPQQAMRLGVVYVPEDRQQHGLVLPMSIAHNITLPILSEVASLGWMNNDRERQLADRSARQLDVRAVGVWQEVRELSGGNQQKVVLAKWLAVQPKILILDEPTRGIDVGTKAEVHRRMGDLAAQGIAILMISSELPEVLCMSDRILVMHEGRITGHFSRAEATQENVMLAATSNGR
jgi:ABC-type sugar transport system ATPase subunit